MKIRTAFIWLIVFAFAQFAVCPSGMCAVKGKAGAPSRVSMDLQDVPLKQLLKVFSQESGLNFVASQEIENRNVTLYLDEVTVEDALDTILKANKLSYVQPEGSSIFYLKDTAKPAIETETRIYKLAYAQVSGVESSSGEGGIETVLEELLTEYGNIAIDPRTNSLLVTDIAGRFELIEKAIDKLDVRTQQVLISAQILEVSVDTLNRLGIEWGSSTGQMAQYTGPSRTTSFPFEESLLKGGASSVTMATLSMTSLTSIFKAIATDSDTHYLARPKLLTLDNKTAEIKITQDAAVATANIQVGAEGGLSQSTDAAERYEVGTSLKVTPHINKDSYITMTIEPEVSRVKTAAISGYYDPHKRYAKTTVMVKDRETVVIAGLISREDTIEKRKVPFLADIPVLGMPFRRNTDEKKDTEIVIFITPQIVRDDVRMAKGFDDMDFAGLADMGTQGVEAIVREQEAPLSDRELAVRNKIR